jgi:RNA polymerase sigma-70 factor (ECF subfamily)
MRSLFRSPISTKPSSNDKGSSGHFWVMAVLEGKSERVADADVTRFEAIYSSCATAVLAYLMRRLPDADAKDVAAETFVVVWRRLAEVPSDPMPWVIGIARNQVRNASRSERRRTALTARVRDMATGTRWQDLPEHAAVAPDDLVWALAVLSEADREVLILVAWDQLDAKQSAEVLGCTTSAFRVRLHRARKRLTTQLERAARSDSEDREGR